ncbi:unnamed protein product, partial [Heterotrigona itama]
ERAGGTRRPDDTQALRPFRSTGDLRAQLMTFDLISIVLACFPVFQERLSRFLDAATTVADVRLHLSEQPHEKTLRQNFLDEFLPSSTSIDLSGTDSALYPFDPQQESYQEIWLPPTSMYPYFLFPGAARTSYYDHESTYDVQEPGQRRQHGHRHQHGRHQEAPELPGRPGVLVVETYDPRADHENRQEARA